MNACKENGSVSTSTVERGERKKTNQAILLPLDVLVGPAVLLNETRDLGRLGFVEAPNVPVEEEAAGDDGAEEYEETELACERRKVSSDVEEAGERAAYQGDIEERLSPGKPDFQRGFRRRN